MADPIEELRTLASAAPATGELLAPYLAKVRTGAYAVSDRDVDGLLEAGVAEDEIFQATVAAAIGEGLRRLDAALEAIG